MPMRCLGLGPKTRGPHRLQTGGTIGDEGENPMPREKKNEGGLKSVKFSWEVGSCLFLLCFLGGQMKILGITNGMFCVVCQKES